VLEAALDPAPVEARFAEIPDDLGFEAALVAAATIAQERVIGSWRIISSVASRYHEKLRKPMADSEALIALFDRHRDQIAVPPVTAARFLRALVFSTTHPMFAHEPMAPEAI